MIVMNNTSQVAETMLFSTLLSSGICTQQQKHEGEKKVKRRRRRKSKGEGEEAKKRRLSEEQVKFLETSFERETKLESGRKVHLASEIGLDPKQVAVWFQNKRARWKSKQLEEEYMKLKSAHESTIFDKCHLEAEVLKLKEQLSEAQKEIIKLSNTSLGEMISSSPSSTSFSVDTTHRPFLGDDELVYINEYNYVNMLDWVDFYGM